MTKFAGKAVRRKTLPKNQSTIDVKRSLAENNTCYVLITCGSPSEDGKMQVEMSYEGDPVLAAYLVESAQNIMDSKDLLT